MSLDWEISKGKETLTAEAYCVMARSVLCYGKVCLLIFILFLVLLCLCLF